MTLTDRLGACLVTLGDNRTGVTGPLGYVSLQLATPGMLCADTDGKGGAVIPCAGTFLRRVDCFQRTATTADGCVTRGASALDFYQH